MDAGLGDVDNGESASSHDLRGGVKGKGMGTYRTGSATVTTGEVTGDTTGSLELTRSQLVDSLRKSEWYLSLEGNDRRTVMGAIIEGLVSRKHVRK